jgi:hypothetical protein
VNLYLISQTEEEGYDTYDSAVVCAASEDEARKLHPSGRNEQWGTAYSAWCAAPESVTVKQIGVAVEERPAGIVLASFNAG